MRIRFKGLSKAEVDPCGSLTYSDAGKIYQDIAATINMPNSAAADIVAAAEAGENAMDLFEQLETMHGNGQFQVKIDRGGISEDEIPDNDNFS